MHCVKWVWIKCKPGVDPNRAIYFAVCGHIERSQLRARLSPADPVTSVDVEFLHFDQETIAVLKSLNWVEDAGIIADTDQPQGVPPAETIRSQYVVAA